ncbi:hypothetical protein BJ742DRAFT_231027 [Cladochytrium replicatum]|nr:hypothetical protein BJ742DRAFT_231027 [Cladochytrium replicatum]
MGRIDILERLKSGGYNLACWRTFASCNGHTDVLDWFMTSGFELKWPDTSIIPQHPGTHTCFELVEADGLELDFICAHPMDRAANVEVLDWCKESGYDLSNCYTTYATYNASRFGHVDILDWWKNSGLPMRFATYIVTTARNKGLHHGVDSWESSGLLSWYKYRSNGSYFIDEAVARANSCT